MRTLTIDQAIGKAQSKARKTGEIQYLVIADGELHVCNDTDLDTFYYGCDPLYAIEPDGTVSQ